MQRSEVRPGRGKLPPDHVLEEHAIRLTRAPIAALPGAIGELIEAIGARLVAFRTCAALLREASRERRWSARHGPRSAAFVPIVVGEATLGVVGAGTIRRERSWGRTSLAFLERAAVALANALARLRALDATLGAEGRLARDEALRLRDEIARRARTAMLAEMGSGIAHELNQPLTAILSNSEAAQRLLRSGEADTAALREALQDVLNETRRAAEILGRMREMLRHRPVQRVPVDVAEALGNVAGRFREEAVVRGVRLTLECEPGVPPVLGDRVQLEGHGGLLLARNNALRGATFEFDLPAAPIGAARGMGEPA